MRKCATTLQPEMWPEELSLLTDTITGLAESDISSHRYLEIGTAAGGTLVRMLQCFATDNRPRFVVVDRMNYFPRQHDRVLENLHANGFSDDDVDLRALTSHVAFLQSVQSSEKFDFILVDASHKIISVTADLRWSRLLNQGGLMCFHDYGPKFPGVTKAIDRFLAKNAHFERVAQVRSLLVIRKKASANRAEVDLTDRCYAAVMHFPIDMHRRRLKRMQNAA